MREVQGTWAGSVAAGGFSIEPDAPAFIVDSDMAQRGISRVRVICGKAGIAIRRHIKTRIFVEFTHKQHEARVVRHTWPADLQRRVSFAVCRDNETVARGQDCAVSSVGAAGSKPSAVRETARFLPNDKCLPVSLHDAIATARDGAVTGWPDMDMRWSIS